MKVIFMGTPGFSVPFLEALQTSEHQILLGVTQPDKPKGRGRKLQFTPVKKAALNMGVALHQPKNVNDWETKELIASYDPDIIVTAAFGQKLSKEIINLPRYGAINVHASLLPKYRGAAPIQRAVMDGKNHTGLTIFQMNEKMDAGEILNFVVVKIGAKETAGDVYKKMIEKGPGLLLETLNLIEKGKANPRQQDETKATYAPKLKAEDEKINFKSSKAEAIYNQVRALNPQPGAYTTCQGERVKVWECQIIDPEKIEVEAEKCNPGEIVKMTQNGPVVKCLEGFVVLTRVQFACKQPVTGKDLYCGKQMAEMMCLG